MAKVYVKYKTALPVKPAIQDVTLTLSEAEAWELLTLLGPLKAGWGIYSAVFNALEKNESAQGDG